VSSAGSRRPFGFRSEAAWNCRPERNREFLFFSIPFA